VVSVTDPYGCILGFLGRSHYFFLPSSSSIAHRPSDYRLSTKLVPTFVHGVCHVVSVTSLRLYLRLSRPEPLLFLPSSSSVVLTRLSNEN
jgi:hypothetical protein